MALGAPRRADGALDAVAGDQLAALDLGGGDVGVLVGRLGRRDAHEGRAVGQQLDGPVEPAVVGVARGGRLGDRLPLTLALARGRLGLGLGVAAAAAAPATPAAARGPRRGVGLLVGGLGRLRGVGGLDRLGELGLGLGLGTRGSLGLRVGVRLGRAGLTGDDGVDQLGLAQAAEAVDPELVGQQVQVGERALLQLGAVEH